jgi:hypothetical protein
MKDTDKVELTVEAVRRAAGKCGTAKEVLKELFPEAFEEGWEDVTDRVGLWGRGDMVYPALSIDGVNKTDAYITGINNYVGAELVFKLEAGRIWRRKSA